MFMCVKLNWSFDRELKVYYVTQVIKQSINIKTMCTYYVFEFRNTKFLLLQVYLGTLINIEIVIETQDYSFVILLMLTFIATGDAGLGLRETGVFSCI